MVPLASSPSSSFLTLLVPVYDDPFWNPSDDGRCFSPLNLQPLSYPQQARWRGCGDTGRKSLRSSFLQEGSVV